MLTMDMRPFKTDMHETLDRWDGLDPNDVPKLVAEIDATIALHRVPLNSKYARALSKIMLVGRRDRAGKLVDCLNDRALSRGGETFVRLAVPAVKFAVLIGLIWIVVWVAT